jgi:hypothetical protein
LTRRGIPSRFGPEVAPPRALEAQIRAAVRSTVAPRIGTRARLAVTLALTPLVTAAVSVVAAVVLYDRAPLSRGLEASSPWPLLVAVLGCAALSLASTLIAVRPGRDGLGSSAPSLLATAALVPALLALVALAGPWGAAGAHGDVSPWGLRCALVAGLTGVLVAAGFAAALRRAAPVAGALRGAALGAAAGAWAALAVAWFCPGGGQAHILVGHVLPPALIPLLGALALPRALRP